MFSLTCSHYNTDHSNTFGVIIIIIIIIISANLANKLYDTIYLTAIG
jgi:hypothetical protein